MTGGLMQLVAYGAQDIYLTGNPMITFFKVVYRRHTNFAMESIQQTFSGTVDFNSRVRATISRNGDLISGAFIEFTLPHLSNTGTDAARWIDSLGHYLVKEVEVEIGGQLIDRHYADWLEIWAQLTVPASQASSYFEMIGLDGRTGLQTLSNQAAPADPVVAPGANLNANGNRVLYVPLQFWFCRNYGLALPLIALQYHEVNITLTIESLNNVAFSLATGLNANTVRTNYTTTGSLGATLWVDYIYLDTDERRRFAQVSHEYLIEQLQFNGNETYNRSTQHIDLNFNHPCKELIWVSRQNDMSAQKQWINFTNTQADSTKIGADAEYHGRPKLTYGQGPTATTAAAITTYRQNVSSNMTQRAILKLNGHDRFESREGTYFNRVQVLNHHTKATASPGINVYSFALKPEDHQPSGTCNFSRIDNARLTLTLNTNVSVDDGAGNVTAGTLAGVTKVFATNYNVLRIMSGMGGLAYSN